MYPMRTISQAIGGPIFVLFDLSRSRILASYPAPKSSSTIAFKPI